MKTCVTCGANKELSEFHRNKAMSDGRHKRCKECRRGEGSVV